jgi:hypothetical protein
VSVRLAIACALASCRPHGGRRCHNEDPVCDGVRALVCTDESTGQRFLARIVGMRGRLIIGLATTITLLVGGFAACVSDSNSNAPNPGSLGGACLQNGTCDTGLVCTIVGSAASCEPTDAGGMDASVDQTNDVATADASDASDAKDTSTCDAPITASFPCTGSAPIGCYDYATSMHQCLASATACLNSAYTTPFVASCFANADCKSATPWCCLGAASPHDLNSCPGTLMIVSGAGTSCTATPCVDAGETPLCNRSAPCPDGHACIPVNTPSPPGLAGENFGICAP